MSLEQLIAYVLLPLAGYLLGSIPFAFVIGKAKGTDIRTVGSKNIGATNLGRTFGKKYFFYAFFCDALKGTLPVLAAALFAQHVNVAAAHDVAYWNSIQYPANAFEAPPHTLLAPLPSWTPLLTAIACVLGHNFPIFLKFRGGKGVATSFGVVMGFWPLYTLGGLAGITVFIMTLFTYRFISLASMAGATAFFAAVVLIGMNQKMHLTYLPPHELTPLAVVAGLFTALIIFRHKSNIRRLLNGTEPKIGQRDIDKAKLKPLDPPPN